MDFNFYLHLYFYLYKEQLYFYWYTLISIYAKNIYNMCMIRMQGLKTVADSSALGEDQFELWK